jgi:hypothetical protein
LAIIVLNATQSNAVSAPGFGVLAGYPVTDTQNVVKSIWVLTKTAGSEPANQTFTFASTNARGLLLTYRNVNRVREARVSQLSVVSQAVAPAVTTMQGARVLRIVSAAPANHSVGITAPADLETRFDTGQTLNFTLYAGDQVSASANALAMPFGFRDSGGAPYLSPYTAITLSLEP